MADIGAPTLRVLKTFVASVDKDPDLLHKSELSFFKDYLTKMGAKIPEAKAAVDAEYKDLIDRGAWDVTTVREFHDVKQEARPSGRTIHAGRILSAAP